MHHRKFCFALPNLWETVDKASAMVRLTREERFSYLSYLGVRADHLECFEQHLGERIDLQIPPD